MKMLVHRIPVASGLPVALEVVKDHVRIVGSHDDDSIAQMIETAAAEVEHFAQIALLSTTIRVTIFKPQANGYDLSLPIGPVADDATPTVTIDGDPFTAFDFVGGGRPYIRWLASYHDLHPERISVEYTAGWPNASAIPSDLAQAVADQAALHYDGRSPMDAKSLTSSPHMARVGARYRGVRA